MTKTFRQTWEGLADHVLTSPCSVASWYSDEQHRLRLSYRPSTGEVRLYETCGAHSWRLVDAAQWDATLEPRVVAHRARAALICARDKYFPERPAAELAAGREVRFRREVRLATVRRGVAGVVLLALLWCAGCERAADPVAPAPAVEVAPQPGADRCAREGHQYMPCRVRSEWSYAGPWVIDEVLCLRCLQRTKVR